MTEFAGSGRRLTAWLIDYLIVSIAAYVLPELLADPDRYGLVAGALALVIWPTYAIVLIGLRGQTLGRMALGIRVVNLTDGRPPSWNRSTIRILIQIGLLVIPIFAALNYVRVLWDPQRRAWHDRAVQTIVVRLRRVRGPGTTAAGASAETLPAAAWSPPLALPLSRPRRGWLVGITVVGGLGLFGLLYGGVYRYLEDDLVNVDFRNWSDPFEVGEDETAAYDLVEGTYRVTLKREGAWALTLGELRRTTYALGVRAELVDVADRGVQVGVGCVGNSPTSEGLGGYLFAVAPGGEFTLERGGSTIREGSDPRIQSVRQLSIWCVPARDGNVVVLGFANGLEVIRHDDAFGQASYTYALLAVRAEAGNEVRFTKVWSRVPDEEWGPEVPISTPPAEPLDRSTAGEPDTPPAEDPDAQSEGVFVGNGVSFRYPPGWDVQEVRTPFAARWDVEWSIAAGPPGGRFRHEDVRVIALPSGGAPAGNVAESRIDAIAQGRGVVEGPTPTSLRGLPAFETRILGYQRYGRLFDLRVVMIVNGASAYEISCRYEPGDSEIIEGCDRIVDSFRISG